MKNLLSGCSLLLPLDSTPHLAQRRLECAHKLNSKSNRMNKNGERFDNLVLRLQKHVSLGFQISETLKRKLRMGAKILQVGVDKVFKQNFSVKEGEKLLKFFNCYLSTTAGPISGFLFISTDKIAFCSERLIKISSPSGEIVRFHYKVSIPLSKIKTANESKSTERPSRKYLDIVTIDNFDFWFMGFLNYRKTYNYIQRSISQTQ